jgi:hypothetical protein
MAKVELEEKNSKSDPTVVSSNCEAAFTFMAVDPTGAHNEDAVKEEVTLSSGDIRVITVPFSTILSDPHCQDRCRLPPEDELFAGLLHAYAHHELSGVRALLDAALLARQHTIDWDYVASLAEKSGSLRMIELGLTFASYYLGLPELFPTEMRYGTDKLHTAYERQVDGSSCRRDYLRWVAARLACTPTVGGWLTQAVRLASVDELTRFFFSGRRKA